MKKLIFSGILLLCLTGITGCTKDKLILNTKDIEADTLLAKSNGAIQAATVEEFNKDYYNLNELEEFVMKEINSYNQASGGENVVLDELERKDGNAVMILSYTGMKHYAEFNKVWAAYFNGGNKEVPMELPDHLVNVKNGSAVNTADVIQNEKLKILIVNEPFDVVVDGSILYHSDNAVIIDKNKLQGSAEGFTVIVYKP
ncbi:MAG: hypothetical protein E7255_09485 [Lachnospiraceae bacterium]|jgi:hypothetical protein|nr:hypothetical protein [Lachnospiraceae bacterium]